MLDLPEHLKRGSPLHFPKSKDFQEIWNLLHYIGAIDGKHVAIKSPLNSGSSYFNYKGILALF